MDGRRAQLSREAHTTSSGCHAGHRPCPVGVRGRASFPHSRVHGIGQRNLSSLLLCRATQGSSQPNTVTLQAASAPPRAAPPSSRASQAPLSHSPSSPPPAPPSPAAPPPPAVQPAPSADPLHRSVERVRRLTALVETRRLYRNCIRAAYLLSLSSPLYTPSPQAGVGTLEQLPEQAPGDAGPSSASAGTGNGSSTSGGGGGSITEEEAVTDRSSSLGSVGSLSSAGSLSSGGGSGPAARGPSPEEDKALKSALDSVAEMALVAEQLKASLRYLPPGFGAAVFPPAEATANEEQVREVARQYGTALRERLAAELPLLPISSDAALHYIEARNAKYSRRVAWDELQGASGAAGAGSAGASGGAGGGGPGDQGSSGPRASPLERLEAAERVAGEIIANSIKPALKKASEQDPLEVLRSTGGYLKGLWVRLNGGSPAGGRAALAGLDLPLPVGSQELSEEAISQLTLDLEALEKKLQEASKNRENKLRKAGLQGRVQMAIQLKGLDAEVLQLSSQLAVRTLQLEMEFVYGSLEAEALDVFNGVQNGGLLARDGSTNELALLVAEFALLDEQLTLLAAALEGGGLGAAAAHGGTLAAAAVAGPAAAGQALVQGASAASAAVAVATAAAAMGPALVSDDVLRKLAAEIPDMRSRVGVADQTVFGGQGFSLTKARLQMRESLDKVREAVTFLTRGVKLLGSDVGSAARLFVKAALGNTLKPREVSALRRTARDLLTFIPFIIILIIPLSPLGHVLVFGFIQRYFPSFFPSQFSSRRQDIMVRYEELERQLLEAQANAEAAEEEVELARAREAVARLTAPESLGPAGVFGLGLGLGLGAAGTAAAEAAAAAAAVSGFAPGSITPAPGGAPHGSASGPTAAPVGTGGNGGGGLAKGSGGGGGFGEGNGGSAGAAVGAGSGPVVAAAVQASLGLGASVSTLSTMSSLDEVTLHEATQKVRILAEQLDEIRDDVNMGEVAEGAEGPGHEGPGSSRRH